MLTFKKGSYNKQELKILHDAILSAYCAIPCNRPDFNKEKCYACTNYKICCDLCNLLSYIDTLITYTD